MCRVIINNQEYIANNFSRNFNTQLIREGTFRARGRITNSVTFSFEQDMNFLTNEKTITLSTTGNINLSNITVREIVINDDNPQIVTFFY